MATIQHKNLNEYTKKNLSWHSSSIECFEFDKEKKNEWEKTTYENDLMKSKLRYHRNEICILILV